MYEFESSLESYIMNYIEKIVINLVGLLSINVDNISQIYNIWMKVKDYTVRYHLLLVAFTMGLFVIKLKTLANAIKASNFIIVLALDSYLADNGIDIKDINMNDVTEFCRKYIKDHVEYQQKTNNASYIRCILQLLKYDLLDGVIAKNIKNYNPCRYDEVK